MSNPSYIITGRKDSGCYDRLEIEELQKQPKQFTLFVLAFLALQGRPFEVPGVKPLPTPEIPSPVQFPELAGIPGLPFKEWIGDANKYASDFDLKDPKDTEPVPSRFGGYCNHGSVVFPTWHRPYVMAIEQAIGDIATQLAENFAINYPKDSPEEWRKAARELRFPFWDWAAKKVPVSNPLAFYPFQSIPEGFEDEILDVLFGRDSQGRGL
ncbi:hypothetical protein MPER_10378 [Moniliophthora perniciosa FA553]|nr:hypothetical protein MPER_10378 [Moniliophthora perniciosa FA553]